MEQVGGGPKGPRKGIYVYIWLIHFIVQHCKATTVVQSLSHVWLSVTPWTIACQASLSAISQSLFKLRSIESVIASNHLILVAPFSSCPQFFPVPGSFPVSQLFASGGQNIGASASVLPMNTQGWSPLRLTGWISLQSTGLSRIFSSTTIQKHQFFGAQPSLWFQLSHLYTTTGNYTPV